LGLDLVTLRIFKAAVEERSLVRVAERERLALSAVSRRLTQLEARVNVALLRRHDRGVEPTAAGEALLRYLGPLFDLLDRAFADVEAFATGARGHVRLHANMSSIFDDLPEVLAGFQAAHPDIGLSVEERFSVDIIHAVQTGAADLGLVSGTVDAFDLQLIPWRRDRLAVVLPIGHPLAARDLPLRFADLTSEPFVGMLPTMALQQFYRRQAQAVGLVLRERINVASFVSVCRMVEAGLGVAILPETGVQSHLHKVAVRQLAEPWVERHLMLCVRRNPENLPTAARLLAAHLLGRRFP
jgi:DNA-binding transcriptional LysR family regulator